MSRPIIYCPGCSRELYRLTRPRCLWCGTRIEDDQFSLVAAPRQEMFPPPPTMSPWQNSSGSPWARNPFALLRLFDSPRKRDFRIAGTALLTSGILLRLFELFYHLWQAHTMMPLPH